MDLKKLELIDSFYPENINNAAVLERFKIPDELKKKIGENYNEKIVFSFDIFDRKHDFFNLGENCESWYLRLLDVLKDLSKSTWKEITQNKKGIYDPHGYEKGKSNFKFNINKDDLEQNKENAYQIRIDKSHGRIHGFLVGNVYYIHWLDHKHNMYDCNGYPKAKRIKKPAECSDRACITVGLENEKLKHDLKDYEKLIDEFSDKEEIINKLIEKYGNLEEIKNKLL